MEKNMTAYSADGTNTNSHPNENVAAFYDTRVENLADLNAKSTIGGGPAYHHSGIVRSNEQAPSNDDDALAWLFRTEQALTDLVWNLIQGLCPRAPRRFLDAGCGEGATLGRFIQLAKPSTIDVTGITLSPKQAGMARQHVPQGTWLVEDMFQTDKLPESSFDVIHAIESTEYFGSERLPAFMKRATSWLDHSGLLVIVAGSWLEASTADALALVNGFDDHYLTKLSSTAQYRQTAMDAGLEPVAELDLSPTTLNYWKIRAERAVLRNSKDGFVEKIIAKAIESRKGEFRAYAWRRP